MIFKEAIIDGPVWAGTKDGEDLHMIQVRLEGYVTEEECAAIKTTIQEGGILPFEINKGEVKWAKTSRPES